jgi:hypothetical protein
MAKIAILGSSFSKCLYYVKDAPDMSNWTIEEREKWAVDEWPLSFIKQDYEKHWVNLLAKKYPQHEFHIFAKGGAGWEFSEIVLHKVAELKFDRVIVELQEPRLMLYNKESFDKIYSSSAELMLNDNYLKDNKFRSKETSVFNYHSGLFEDSNISHVCFYNECDKHRFIKKQVRKTVQWQLERYEHFNHKQTLPAYTDDVVTYIATNIMGPIYATRYRQFLLSLKNVWPNVFDKVGVWAYLPINLPWMKEELHAEIFGDELKIFEDTAVEEWIRKDPINNSFETWQNIYCGHDRQHANEKGNELVVDFLLKQPSIQKVLE